MNIARGANRGAVTLVGIQAQNERKNFSRKLFKGVY
jgi:hypothetical protein